MKLPYAIILLPALLTVAACSNRKTEIPGTPCVLNSDCKDPLSCFARTCHEACAEDGDCPGAALCVWDNNSASGAAESAGDPPVRVCTLPVDEKCNYDSACTPPLVCGRDLHCRNECQDDVDCAGKDDECVVAGVEIGGTRELKVCAGPDAIGPNGELLTAPALDAGMTMMDAGPGGDASSDGQGHQDGGSGADAGGTGDPCTENLGNDTALTATPFIPGTELQACIGTATDVDYYELTAPADPAGGYYQGSFTDMGQGAISFKIINLADQGTVESYTSNTLSQNRYFYFAAAPGQKYHLIVDPGLKTIFNYKLKIDYTAVTDIHEPNDSRAAAKLIVKGEPVVARVFAPFTASKIVAAGYEDWFSVELLAGPASIALSNLPMNAGLNLQLSNAMTMVNVNGASDGSPNAGGAFTATYAIPTAGRYDLRVGLNTTVPTASDGTTVVVPESFTKSYQLLVTQ